MGMNVMKNPIAVRVRVVPVENDGFLVDVDGKINICGKTFVAKGIREATRVARREFRAEMRRLIDEESAK